jgi:signal transduction histidine kinase
MPSQYEADLRTPGIPLRVRPTDVRALLRSYLVVMQAQAAATDVSLTVSVAEDVPQTVRLDPTKIGWAVVNLVGNALRYVRHGPRARGGALTVAVTYEPAAAALVIEVRDNGPGIAPATVSRLFEHDDPQGPSGLGLLLVHDIVVAHGGSVEVRSSRDFADHGTAIRLTVPDR